MRKQSQQVTEILHTHRNQARYFAVFLMLSALVISFVCSTLPSTGGIGTTIFYGLGGVLVLGSGVALITKKRMKKDEE